MNKIISKRFFSENVAQIEVEAPLIAASRKAGHFVIVRVDDHSERMPLTISAADTAKGTITLVVQRIGVSSAKLLALNEGDAIHDIVGPLGRATRIENYGTVICACGGVGAAPMLPIAEALHKAGNRVITILAARTAELIILKEELQAFSDELIIMTDDGSLGQQGLVTAGIEAVVAREQVDKCITIGPAIMMKFVALTTKKYNIPTEASLNTIMVDGTGMCGACRVTVGGQTKFVCVDGPEFDAHQVDFDQMLSRLRSYKPEEAAAYEAYQEAIRPLTAKERAALPRVKMNEVAPSVRVQSLRMEVNQGLTLTQAMQEAKRCLNCKNAGCIQGCPVGINIPAFIHQLGQGDILGAADIIKGSSSLPAVCGRVCPQEKQCEAQCIHLKMNHEPVAIGYLERFVADHSQLSTINSQLPPSGATTLHSTLYTLHSTTAKIAVVGSGPSGLSFAGDMAKLGYQVTVFEALHEIGGVLKYGIPEFRLPNRIVDQEIENLKQLGIEFKTDIIIGKTLTIEDLQQQGFAGIFVGSGAGLPRFMGIPGENLNGVLSCNEYLTRVNLMDASSPSTDTPLLYGKNVIVVGGGNTAMDAVRTAKRLGAEHATIVYRRSEEEMPARIEEVRHAKEEGIEFLTLHNPIEYHDYLSGEAGLSAEGGLSAQRSFSDSGRVKEAVLQVMTLGEPDESGRRSPVAVEGKTITIPADLVIVAVGVSPNPLIPSSVAGLEISKKGTIVVNEGMQSSLPILFAGGDIVRGGATVILAMSDGRKAAAAMHDYLLAQSAK